MEHTLLLLETLMVLNQQLKLKDGKDGKTATITTTENPDGSHTITVTNPDGTTKETVVKNGKER